MERLPSEIALDILSRLPVESVLDCELVCKSLHNLLTSRREHFARLHHHRQLLQHASSTVKFGYLFSFVKSEERTALLRPPVRLYYGEKYNDEMNIHENFCYKKLRRTDICMDTHSEYFLVGSCNGLVCLNRYHRPICICNPITREYVNLPEHNLIQAYSVGVLGFGYVAHSETNYEYKVVTYYPTDFVNGEVQVYSIGSGRGWRTKATASYNFGYPKPVGVFANEALHWREGVDILAFSLADEEFRLVQPVPCLNPIQVYGRYELHALGGKLCLSQDRYEEFRLDIWSLKRNGMEESWTRDFSIAYSSAYLSRVLPILVTKKNEVLLVHQESMLYCYDPETSSLMQLWSDDSMTNVIDLRAVPHMNSFVSLKALGENSKKKKIDADLE